jgi:hypothetical protein
MTAKRIKNLKLFPLSLDKSFSLISFSTKTQICNSEMSRESSCLIARTWLSHRLDWTSHISHESGRGSHGSHGSTSRRADGQFSLPFVQCVWDTDVNKACIATFILISKSISNCVNSSKVISGSRCCSSLLRDSHRSLVWNAFHSSKSFIRSSISIEPQEFAESERTVRERIIICECDVSYHQVDWARVAKTAKQFSNLITWLLEVRHVSNNRFLFVHYFVLHCIAYCPGPLTGWTCMSDPNALSNKKALPDEHMIWKLSTALQFGLYCRNRVYIRRFQFKSQGIVQHFYQLKTEHAEFAIDLRHILNALCSFCIRNPRITCQIEVPAVE